MAETNYYDKLDLKYPEIAIAIDKIDRLKPGLIRFNVPVLTPNLTTNGKASKSDVHQSASNIQNQNPIKISNISITNYISCKIPKELCSNDISRSSVTGTMIIGQTSGSILGGSYINLVDYDRYIPAGSKWIIVFIGGDINKPQIIGRYTE